MSEALDFGFGRAPEGLTAEALGENTGDSTPTEDAIVAQIREVHDPEIPVNIYDLGLIYDIVIDAGRNVAITMSLTAPGCPVAGEMPQQVADAAACAAGVRSVRVTLTFEPAWTPARMSEDARLALGFDY